MTNEQAPSPMGSAWEASNQQQPAAMPWQTSSQANPGQQAAPQTMPPAMPQAHEGKQPMPQQWQHTNQAVAQMPQAGRRPVGKIRSSGMCILLAIVTLGIYGIYWNSVVHQEMKKHTGQGFGGVAAFFLSLIPFVMTFLTPSEVGKLYVRQNRQAPVSGMTGFWVFVPFVGAILWFVHVNGALNDYWRSMGVVES